MLLFIIRSFQTLLVLGQYLPGLCSHRYISKRDFKQRGAFLTTLKYCHTCKCPGYLINHLCFSNFIISDSIIVQIKHSYMCTYAHRGTRKLFKDLGKGGKPYHCITPQPKPQNINLKQAPKSARPLPEFPASVCMWTLNPFQRAHQDEGQDENKSLVHFSLSDSSVWQYSLLKNIPEGCVFFPRT